MRRLSKTQLGMFASSLVILGTLSVQAIVVFGIQFGPIESPPYLWPFLDYPMYNQAHFEGEAITFYVLLGILPDSTEIVIEPDDLRMDFWHFHKRVIWAVATNDRVNILVYRALYESRHNSQLSGLRLEVRPLLLTSEGVVDGEREILRTVSFESDGDLP